MPSESNTDAAVELVRSLTERAGLLRAAATMANTGQPDPRDEAVRLALARASELARAGSHLGASKNSTALSLVARATLENLIVLLWVVISEANAHELKASAIGELARVARVNFEKGNARVVNRKTGEDATKEILSGEKFKKKRHQKAQRRRTGESSERPPFV